MEQLLRKLEINPNQNTEVILEELGKVQMEYLERLDSVEDEKRKSQLEADLKEIESAISSLSWMANRTSIGMKRDEESKEDFSDLKNQQEEESKKEPEKRIDSQAKTEEALFDEALAVMGTPDYADGIRMMRKLAEDGYLEAQFQMGKLYQDGNRIPQDYQTALAWFKRAAEQGNLKAQTNIGNIYFYGGNGVIVDYEMAANWYRIPAAQGEPVAACNLGYLYHWGYGGLNSDLEKAEELYLKAADAGIYGVLEYLGNIYKCDLRYPDMINDHGKLLKYYQKAADLGIMEAQYQMALRYDYGVDVEHNGEKALELFEKAAEQGHERAPFHVALCYRYVRCDYTRAKELFQKLLAQEPESSFYKKQIKELEKLEKNANQSQESGGKTGNTTKKKWFGLF